MSSTHNPFRVRTAYDKICVWFDINGKPSRRYCTRTFRTKDGALGLERIGHRGSKISTAAHAAYIHPVILIERIA